MMPKAPEASDPRPDASDLGLKIWERILSALYTQKEEFTVSYQSFPQLRNIKLSTLSARIADFHRAGLLERQRTGPHGAAVYRVSNLPKWHVARGKFISWQRGQIKARSANTKKKTRSGRNASVLQAKMLLVFEVRDNETLTLTIDEARALHAQLDDLLA